MTRRITVANAEPKHDSEQRKWDKFMADEVDHNGRRRDLLTAFGAGALRQTHDDYLNAIDPSYKHVEHKRDVQKHKLRTKFRPVFSRLIGNEIVSYDSNSVLTLPAPIDAVGTDTDSKFDEIVEHYNEPITAPEVPELVKGK